MRLPRLTIGSVILALILGAWMVATVRILLRDGPHEPDPAKVREARSLLVEVDRTELCYWERYGRYSDSIADLQLNASKVPGSRLPGAYIMSSVARSGLTLDIDAGRTGGSYVQRIKGNGVDTYFERRGTEFADYADLAWGHVKDRCVAR